MLVIHPANAAEHSEIIARLIQTAFAEQAAQLKLRPDQYPNFVGFETPERTAWRLGHGDTAVLAWRDGEIIGTISYQIASNQPATGYIKRLAILPTFRGLNYGEILMEYAEEQLRTGGITRAEISIVADFQGLHNYYRRLGYLDGALTEVPTLPFKVQYLYKHLGK